MASGGNSGGGDVAESSERVVMPSLEPWSGNEACSVGFEYSDGFRHTSIFMLRTWSCFVPSGACRHSSATERTCCEC